MRITAALRGAVRTPDPKGYDAFFMLPEAAALYLPGKIERPVGASERRG